MAGGALAQTGEPGACRARAAAKEWKNGARCAFAISFDSDHETNELRDGGKSIGRMAWGQFGNRVGVPRILKLLKKYEVPATFYVPAVTALLYPDEQRHMIAEGHEIGIHSWIHELNSVLSYEAESDIMHRAADTLEKITGVRPVGARTASWDFSPHTLRITKEMGLLYDSSLMADEDCYELLLDGEPTGVVELPVEWIRDDAVYFMMHRFQNLRPQMPVEAVFDIFRREFDMAYEEGGICQITTHPHFIGYRSRIWIIEELIRHAKSRAGSGSRRMPMWPATPRSMPPEAEPMTKTALVTGGARGIGRACALALADSGFDIALVDLPGEGDGSNRARYRGAGQAHAALSGRCERFCPRACDRRADQCEMGSSRRAPEPNAGAPNPKPIFEITEAESTARSQSI